MFLTTRGLILREAKYKESDKILTILTETDGKITAKARGVARTRSRLSAAVQLLSFADFTFFGNRGLWTINEAESVEQFRGLRGDLNLLSLGSYIAELLESVSNEDVPEPEILQLGLNALFALSNRVCPPEQVKAAFELRLMCLSGYRPELDACAACGREEMDAGRLFADSGVPVHRRNSVPVIYSGGKPVAAFGVAVSSAHAPRPGQRRLVIARRRKREAE